ncbi:MAG TPA: hypothetical protein VJN43_21245 [Bryobacteraceae bacterium]|nr:hypothetical protein [Bryobacteraceae bacterium]
MKIRNYWFLAASLMLAGLAAAATLEGPHMGVVFDARTKALRPILGMPGSATVGDALKLNFELDQAAVSPLQDYVLATVAGSRQVMVVRPDRRPVVATALQGADASPDQIQLSAHGSAALLYHADRNRIQVVTGLPDAAKVSGELILSAYQVPSTLAVADDGHTVLAGVEGTVYLVTPNGEVPILTGLRKITAMSLGAGRTALVADGAKNRIYRISDVSGPAEAIILGDFRDGIDGPSAVAISDDGNRGFVANGRSGTVAMLDLRGQSPIEKIACHCKPTGLDRLAGNGVYRLTEPSDKPMWVLEAGAHAPRMLFVPAMLPRSSEK